METGILVISPCSGSKRYDAVVETEEIDTRSREELVREHPDAVTVAEEMYTGREHQLIQSAVREFESIATVDWKIVSAGFGVLSRDTRIPSYDCTFSEIEEVRTRARRMGLDVDSMTNDELVEAVGREKGIPQSLRETLGENMTWHSWRWGRNTYSVPGRRFPRYRTRPLRSHSRRKEAEH